MAHYYQGKQARSSSVGWSNVHDHVLPPGWTCRHDANTGKFYFIYEVGPVEHGSPSKSSDDESTVGPAIPMPSTSKMAIKATPSEANVERIYKQFPDVEKSYIYHLMKMYNNRENLVISALLADSHPRHSPVLDEALFYKLKQSFPHIEPESIRKILIQNQNREHPTIAALLNLFGLFNTTRYEHHKKPQLKLKYLKFAFPQVDVMELLDLLYKNEFDVSRVIKHLQSIGLESEKEITIKMSKLSETALLKEVHERLNAPRPKTLPILDEYHPNLWEQEKIRRSLMEQYPQVDVFLVNWALEATKFNVELAKQFLDTMTPQDEESYLIRSSIKDEIETGHLLISREVQTGYSVQDYFGNAIVIRISLETEPKSVFENRMDKATCTREDGFMPKWMIKRAIGPDPKNRKGANPANRQIELCHWLGPMAKRNGPNPGNRQGPARLEGNIRIIRQGPQDCNRIGRIGPQLIRLKDIDKDDENENEFMRNYNQNIYVYP